MSSAPSVSRPRLGRWQGLEFAEEGALALDESYLPGGTSRPLELVSVRAPAVLSFPEGYIPGRSEAMRNSISRAVAPACARLPLLKFAG